MRQSRKASTGQHLHCQVLCVFRARAATEAIIVYRFTDSVPYLLNRAGVMVAERFSRRLGEYDVSLQMYRVLAVLRQTGSHTLGELSELVSVELSTLSRLVGIMVRRGLVTRTRPAENGRIVIIDLTAAGRAISETLMPIAAGFEALLIEGLRPDQVQELKTILKAMYLLLERRT